jgi:hypothetical protein
MRAAIASAMAAGSVRECRQKKYGTSFAFLVGESPRTSRRPGR